MEMRGATDCLPGAYKEKLWPCGWGKEKIGLFEFWHRFGSVTGFFNLLLRQSLAQTQKSSLRTATVFLYTL